MATIDNDPRTTETAMREEGWFELTDSEKIDALYLAVNDTREKLNNILTIMSDLHGKAGPIIDKLKDSPMIKMLAGG